MEHTGRVEGGRFNPWSPEVWNDDLRRFEGKPVAVTLKRDRATRSGRQNRYLWGVVYGMLAEYTGHTAEEIHEYCKGRFLLPEVIAIVDKKTGVVVEDAEIPASTAKLNTTEFAEYVAQIQVWAADKLGVVIPDPNEELTQKEN